MIRPLRSTLFALALALGCTPAELATSLDARVESGASSPDDVQTAQDAWVAADAPRPPGDANAPGDAGAAQDHPVGADATADSSAPGDAVITQDTPAPVDVVTAPDTPAPVDVVTAPDTPAPRDVVATQDTPTPRDVVSAQDAPAPRDVVAPQDAGCDASGRVIAPRADEVIETCSQSDGAVSYDFRVEVSGAVARVAPRWRTPRGDLAPSPDLARADAPWVFRRQVGGPSATFPALGVFPDALRGTWRFEAVILDRCGGERVVSQTFQLTFTNRRCPNP